MTETNLEIARRGYEAALRGDLETLREFLASDVKWHGGNPSAPGTCHSRDEVVEMVHFPDPADALAAAGV